MALEILEAATTGQLDAVRTLMVAFVAWCRARYADHSAQVNAYFDAATFEAELASLPGIYAPPAGCLLLAEVDGAAAGCGALRPFEQRSCEMKRMFVAPSFQGRGVGRALAERLIQAGRASGYQRMLLDTGGGCKQRPSALRHNRVS